MLYGAALQRALCSSPSVADVESDLPRILGSKFRRHTRIPFGLTLELLAAFSLFGLTCVAFWCGGRCAHSPLRP